MPDIHKHQTPEMDSCIDACGECHDIVIHAIHDCLKKGGHHAESHHIGLLQDCAQMCDTAEDFMLRHSHLHHVTCGACADVCDECAKSCEKLGDNDCAGACRKCAAECRKCAVAK